MQRLISQQCHRRWAGLPTRGKTHMASYATHSTGRTKQTNAEFAAAEQVMSDEHPHLHLQCSQGCCQHCAREGVCNPPGKQQQPEEIQLEILGRKKPRDKGAEGQCPNPAISRRRIQVLHMASKTCPQGIRKETDLHTISSDTL